MSGINRVTLIGNVGQEPEVRYMQNGDAVANVSIATSESWKDKNTGEKQEKTEWHRVVFFRRLAEVVSEYVKKGSKIYIEGKLQTKKWQDKDGNDRYTTEIVADRMQMLDSKGGNQGQAPQQQAPQQAPQPQNNGGGGDGGFDDDIPF